MLFLNPLTLRITKSSDRHYQKKRAEVIRLLGNKCAKCGFSDVRALQIDHKRGGGVFEAKKYGPAMYGRMHKLLLECPEAFHLNYQVLCANCNWIKRHENRERSWSNQEVLDKDRADGVVR